MIRKIMLAAILAGTIGSIATPASAVIYVRVAPPEPRVEVVPERRHGYTWSAGHWQWRSENRRHVWVAGNWVKDRRGHHYVQPAWSERDGRWYMTRGSWQRGDRDGDGIPNAVDRDRDGDGVRNSQDRQPDNPRRY